MTPLFLCSWFPGDGSKTGQCDDHKGVHGEKELGENITGDGQVYPHGVYDSLPTTSSPDDEAVKTDDYFIMNARISRSFKDVYSVYAEVNNLFDKDYEEEIGFPSRGRNFRVGVSLDF